VVCVPYLERVLLLHDKLQSILLVVSAVGSKNILLNQLQERLWLQLKS
jgi:hypothetical protein